VSGQISDLLFDGMISSLIIIPWADNHVFGIQLYQANSLLNSAVKGRIGME